MNKYLHEIFNGLISFQIIESTWFLTVVFIFLMTINIYWKKKIWLYFSLFWRINESSWLKIENIDASSVFRLYRPLSLWRFPSSNGLYLGFLVCYFNFMQCAKHWIASIFKSNLNDRSPGCWCCNEWNDRLNKKINNYPGRSYYHPVTSATTWH